jgi:serine/threonine-protein kinase
VTTDSGDATLADGLTEELITMLSRMGNLRVVPIPSVLELKHRGLDLRQIADSLRVTHILEASLQKVATRLRLQVRLVDARDGSTHWAETYNREMGDMFEVQDEIAGAVARELDLRLAGNRLPSAARRYTPGIVAYEWYLKGMDQSLTRSQGGLLQAVEYLGRAVQADSNFAAAYAALAEKYVAAISSARGDARAVIAERAALKAVALDDSLADAHAALGWVRLSRWDWPAAEAEFTRAIALDPRAPRAYEGLARVYLLTGRRAEQMAAAHNGLDIDPFSVSAIREWALALSMSGRCDEALERLRPLKALNPPAGVAGVIRGQCYAAKGMWPEAVDEFRWASTSSDARVARGFLGYALARAGQQDEARRILSQLLSARTNNQGADAFGIASVYAGLGNYDAAFAWLDKAIDEGWMRPYIMGPMFDDVRRDARFAGVRQRMRL